ncbi:MAG: hypothetical protein BroJett030_18490 [Alphaproteobacteria bacterium]|nr:MAG: hypothetical protein BroJett030_18490 [Alphaproteobacteria bacterium]
MRVTVKGQVTIPKPIRDRLGIGPGSEVAFVPSGDRVEMVRVGKGDGQRSRRAILADSLRRLAGLPGADMAGALDGKQYTDWLRGPRDDADSG